MATKGCQVDAHRPNHRTNPFMAGFSFAPKGAQNAPKRHSGVAGMPFWPPTMSKIMKIRVFQGRHQDSILDPPKVKTGMISTFLATKWPPRDARRTLAAPTTRQIPSWLAFRLLQRAVKTRLNVTLASMGCPSGRQKCQKP